MRSSPVTPASQEPFGEVADVEIVGAPISFRAWGTIGIIGAGIHLVVGFEKWLQNQKLLPARASWHENKSGQNTDRSLKDAIVTASVGTKRQC